MEGRYPPAVMVHLADCADTAREKEFNEWYNNVLIPHVQALDFVRNIKRFENVFGDKPTFQGRPKYLSVWEVYREDLLEARREIYQHVAKLKEQGKDFDAMANMVYNMYGRVGPELRTERTGRPVTGIYMVLNYPTDASRDEEFNKWYNEKHGPEGLAFGVYDTSYRYKVVDFVEPPHQVPYVTLYEPSGDPLKARLAWNPDFIRENWQKDPLWVDLLGVVWTGGFRQIYPPLNK